ncbi:High-affinity methionine permease [Vanrija pseudolonga]|uniref:High-affinity methionine permease n=1 Tax=Vanrija pseudolonga TaxID=143232 RepID=A0AAF0YAZ5_9TREE|nr:High-affinity methionine permease [Vanrija pseudolonga]
MSHRASDDLAQVPHLAGDLGGKRQFVIRGDLAYVGEKGENGAEATYQNAEGAPIETTSPLGYNVGYWSSFFLNVSMIIGTGISSSILHGVGSVSLSLIYWVIGAAIAFSGTSVLIELASYFPSRSGSNVVYLEQAFPRPLYFWPLVFAFQVIVVRFNSGNAFVVASYLFRLSTHTPTDWEIKGVAIAVVTLVSALVIVHQKLSLHVINVLGVVKILTLVFITITGWAVLGGGFKHKVADPNANFRNSFKGTSSDGYGISNALVSIIYSYTGYENAVRFANEVKDPIRTIKNSTFTSVGIVFFLYFFVNIAYFAAIPAEAVLHSDLTTASLYFKTLFGAKAARGLTILPILSAVGNITAVITGQARLIREIGRQGVVPYPHIWVQTKPFGTPIFPVFIMWFFATFFIIVPPAGSAFNFINALQKYPSSFFLALMTVGLYFIRHQRAKVGLPRSSYRSWDFVNIFFFLTNAFLLVMPWVPPKGGLNDSSFGFFYGTAALVGLGFILLCGGYYVLWVKILPKLGNYQIRKIVVTHDDGSIGHQLINVPNDEVDEWDRKHDPAGHSITSADDNNVEYVNVDDEGKEKV